MLHCEKAGMFDSVEIALLAIEEIPLIPHSEFCSSMPRYASDRDSSWQRVRNLTHILALKSRLAAGTNIFVRGQVSLETARSSSPSDAVSVVFMDEGTIVPVVGKYNFPIRSEDLEDFRGWFVPFGADFESTHNPQVFFA
jgi:hypothetical protein